MQARGHVAVAVVVLLALAAVHGTQGERGPLPPVAWSQQQQYCYLLPVGSAASFQTAPPSDMDANSSSIPNTASLHVPTV
jgi:hypothetical protein